MSDDYAEPALQMRDRVRFLVSAILSNTPERIASLPASSLQSFLECNLNAAVLPEAVSAVLKMAVATRLDPSDVAAWLHADDGGSLFDRVSRPRGRPPKFVKRNLEKAASRAARVQQDIADMQGEIADAEALIAHTRQRMLVAQRELEDETRFMGVSSFYLMLEALALVNAKAVAMGPLFTVASALGDAVDRDRITFVLRELHDSTELRTDIIEALRTVVQHHLMKAVQARQAVDPHFDPNEPGAFKSAPTTPAGVMPEDWFGGVDWQAVDGDPDAASNNQSHSSSSTVSSGEDDRVQDPAVVKTFDPFGLPDEVMEVPPPPSFAARLKSDDGSGDGVPTTA